MHGHDAMKEALKQKRARGLDLTILLGDKEDHDPMHAGITDEMNEKTSDLAPEVGDDTDEGQEMGDGPFSPEEVSAEKDEAAQASDHGDLAGAKDELADMKHMTKHLGPTHHGKGLKGAAHKHWLSKFGLKK